MSTPLLRALFRPFIGPLIAAALAVIATAAAAPSARAAAAADAPPLKIVASVIPHAEILAHAQKIAPDLKLDIIEIVGGVNPNELVAHGDADANYFQHTPYLRTQERALGYPFAIVATVHVEPLGVYSRRHKSYAQVPDGGTVSVPNDASNLNRALFLLQAQGLIKLKPGLTADKALATPADIVDNPKHLKLIEIDGPMLARSLGDTDLSVINGNRALEAGLTPSKDALGLEQATGNPYANIVVTRPNLASDPRIKRLAQILQSPPIAQFIQTRYQGSVIPVHPAKP